MIVSRIVDPGGPDGEHLAVVHEKGVVTLWSAKTLRFVGACKLHADHLRTVQFSKDGKRLVTAGLDARVRVWDFPPNSRGGVGPDS